MARLRCLLAARPVACEYRRTKQELIAEFGGERRERLQRFPATTRTTANWSCWEEGARNPDAACATSGASGPGSAAMPVAAMSGKRRLEGVGEADPDRALLVDDEVVAIATHAEDPGKTEIMAEKCGNTLGGGGIPAPCRGVGSELRAPTIGLAFQPV